MPDTTKIATNTPTTIPTTLDGSACCFPCELVGDFSFVVGEDGEGLRAPVKLSIDDFSFVVGVGNGVSMVVVRLSVGNVMGGYNNSK
jgi:hypothetical protein